MTQKIILADNAITAEILFAYLRRDARYDVAIAFPAYVGLTVLSGALVLGEQINALRALGIFLIVLGVAIVSCA